MKHCASSPRVLFAMSAILWGACGNGPGSEMEAMGIPGNDAGGEPLPVTCSESEAYVDGSCIPVTCVARQTHCQLCESCTGEGSAVPRLSTCNETGTGNSLQRCPTGQACDESVVGAATCQKQTCMVDRTECATAKDTKTCNPFGTGYAAPVPCDAGLLCGDERCAEIVREAPFVVGGKFGSHDPSYFALYQITDARRLRHIDTTLSSASPPITFTFFVYHDNAGNYERVFEQVGQVNGYQAMVEGLDVPLIAGQRYAIGVTISAFHRLPALEAADLTFAKSLGGFAGLPDAPKAEEDGWVFNHSLWVSL